MAPYLKTQRKYLAAGLLSTAGLLAFCLVRWCTSFGIGASPDSVTYLQVAHNILAGKGVTLNGHPLTHYPPVYPLLLAFVGLGGSELLEATRWFHAVLFSINLMTVGLIVYNLTQRSLLASLCAILLMLSSSSMVVVHAMAWSESPFLLFALAGYAFLILYINRPGRLRLVITALFLGAATTTRYVGITLILPAAIALLVLQKKPVARRLIDSIFLSVLSSLPILIWLSRNVLLTASATNRTLIYHPIPPEYFEEAIQTVLQWLCPFPGPPRAKVIVLLFIAGILTIWYAYRFKSVIKGRDTLTISLKFQILTLLFLCAYVIFLLFSISFIDIATHLDYRILSPIYTFGVAFVILLIWDINKFMNNRLISSIILLYVFTLSCYNATNTHAIASKMHRDGLWYTSWKWRASEVIEFLRFIPEGIPLYSNGPDVISILLGRESKMIPAKMHSSSRLPNQHFAADMARMSTDLQRDKGLVVYFDNITWRWYLPDKDELQAFAVLSLMRRATDGVIYHRASSD
jgi:hypothetical protein